MEAMALRWLPVVVVQVAAQDFTVLLQLPLGMVRLVRLEHVSPVERAVVAEV
jgi:hypothetical protein